MGIATIFVLCIFVVCTAQSEVSLEADRPYLRVLVSSTADLECCYKATVKQLNSSWVKTRANQTMLPYEVKGPGIEAKQIKKTSDIFCGILSFKSVQLNDSGMYMCRLLSSNDMTYSHGTYLQVYEPLEMTLNFSESTKNRILTAEGILLLLCVILPSVTLLCKSKKLHELEKKKVKKEDENIYQGLNLDDCCTTYDQIERSQGHGPYQDVCNIIEEEEEIQLEKP